MSWTGNHFAEYRERCKALRTSGNPYADGIAWTGGSERLGDARIPLLDQGFLKSDLTYDVPAVWDGRFFRLDEHLDRFDASLEKMRLRNPLGRQGLRQKLVDMVATSGIRDAYVMMTVTRGLNHVRQTAPEDCDNACYLMVMPYVWIMDEAVQEDGGHAIIARTVRRTPPGAMDPTIKNLQWGDLTRGILEARDRGAQYPVLLDEDGNLTEGSGFNVILVKDRTLYSPKSGVLQGVTRDTVFRIGQELGLRCILGEVPVSLAYDADEIMFTTTAGGVMPVTLLDGAAVGDGKVGPVTQALWRGYWDAHYDDHYTLAVDYDLPRQSD